MPVHQAQTESKAHVTEKNLAELIREFTGSFALTWKESPESLPPAGKVYSTEEQLEYEGLMTENLLSIRASFAQASRSKEELVDLLRSHIPVLQWVAQQLFELEDGEFEFLIHSGFLETSLAFVEEANSLDSKVEKSYLIQALPNIWVMNLLQVMFSQAVHLSSAMTAYSLLYPYTDNYLDDPSSNDLDKRRFNGRLRQILEGGVVAPNSSQEETIFNLVSKVFESYPEDQRNLTRAGLQAIHRAQMRSFTIQTGRQEVRLEDITNISIEKGGVSVLVNGCLVNPNLERSTAESLFGYGAFLQFQDDLLDCDQDLKSGIQTVFSTNGDYRTMDRQAIRLLNLGDFLFGENQLFGVALPRSITKILTRSAELIPIAGVALAPDRFSDNLLDHLEERFPVRFGFLREQRNELQDAMPKISSRLEEFSTEELLAYAEQVRSDFGEVE